MGKDFNNFLVENRRVAILRFLAEDSDYSLNDSVIQACLEEIGLGCSRDAIRADFAFLADIGAITFEVVMGSIYVAKLTAKGDDIAKGRAVVPGVKKPGPK